MAHISYPFKKINKTIFQKPINVTNDSLHWKQFGLPVLVKEFGAVDYLDFSPVEPHYFAATCSVRVQVYDPITKTVSKNISKFVEAAYGATFRADGKLLVAGSEEKVVKLFDVQSKNVLRVFTGHTAPVHRTFFTKDQVKILSFSDDKSVGVWDIATEERIASFTEHTDYIRAGAASPVSPNLILSGGYDNLIKLYDCRSNETVLTVNHGSPVESLLYLPSGGVFISAGGIEIKVWDIFNGGKLLSNICQHHKTVTSLRLASNYSRLMSASLDRHVKIYDISTLKVIHNIDFPNAVLSMAISERDNVLAVGMVDGVISIRKREKPAQKSKKVKGLFKFAPEQNQNSTLDIVMKKEQTTVVRQHEGYLRKRLFTKALVTVLVGFVTKKHPEDTAALLQELIRDNNLSEALSGLSDVQIGSLLKFFKKYVGLPLYTRTVIDSTMIFLNTFGNRLKSFSEQNLWLLSTFIDAMDAEIEAGKLALELEGMCRLLLSASQITSSNNLELNEHIVQLAPSSKAQKEIVIDV